MTIRSKFDVGNVLVVYDYNAEVERVMVVRKIDTWNTFTGFQYTMIDYKGFVNEKYDDLDFDSMFEIHRIYKDLKSYKERGGKDEDNYY